MGACCTSHLISMKDLCRAQVEDLLALAASMEAKLTNTHRTDLLRGRIMASLFFQPSTRTRLSFESAMLRLGGEVIGFADGELSRAGSAWSEALSDTARVVDGYADVIVVRHPEVGAASEFARYATKPVINAGDGIGRDSEHPTQALLDLYAIQKARGRIDGVRVSIIGGAHQRACHSLLIGLSLFDGVQVKLVSPRDYYLSEAELDTLTQRGLRVEYASDVRDVVASTDVMYHNGMSENPQEPVADSYRLTLEKVKARASELLILHPLPRATEIPQELDSLPCAGYFRQSAVGVPVRMAILAAILG